MDPMDDILFPGAQNHLSEISGSKGKAESGNQLDANTWPSTPSFNFKPNLPPQSFSPTEMAAIRKANQTTLLEAGNTVVIELLLRIRYLEGKIETLEKTVAVPLNSQSPIITAGPSTSSTPSSLSNTPTPSSLSNTLRSRLLCGTGIITVPSSWQQSDYAYQSISPTRPDTIPEHLWLENLWNAWKKAQKESGKKPGKLTWLVDEESIAFRCGEMSIERVRKE
ncbi:hypothetical protein BT69DRAFT_128688 [Atractiella rhizophila]|nr:hypothetical protein BT69DRAFT_128688 [Atractiella rhizophila]